MKILVGICGIGNGHLDRQSNVIELLLKKGNDVLIATTERGKEYYKNIFPNADILTITIPWIVCDNNGIDFEKTINHYLESGKDYYYEFLVFSNKIKRFFNGNPDLIISDYEPNVAQFAYALQIPLICMEQQSKFLYIDELIIDNFSILEEKARLNYFFPKYDYKIISSFFPLKIKERNVKVIAPIITSLNVLDKKKNHILVYLSPYEDSKKYIEVINVIKLMQNYKFIVYSKEKLNLSYNNILFKKYNSKFKEDLENCMCLISTAGHQLLSEAISINVPIYLIPLNTYEQKYNASMIEKYSLGKLANNISVFEIEQFISSLSCYKKNIKKFKSKYYKYSWQEDVLSIINTYENYKN